jgi:hypothetical protein
MDSAALLMERGLWMAKEPRHARVPCRVWKKQLDVECGTNIPHLLPLTHRESSPIDGGLSVVDARHGTPVRVLLDAAGRRAGPADPDAYPVDLLGDPADRLEDRDGRAASVAGPVGVVLGWLQHVHPAGIAGGPAASPDGLLAYLGCLAEDRDGLLEHPADSAPEAYHEACP